jgi:HAD superfamily hydrolase (TIGR01509 family)
MGFLPAPQGVIFDMDGLLIDTVPVYITAMVEAGGAVGHPVSAAYIRSLVGLLGAALRERLVGDLGPAFPIDEFLQATAARLTALFAAGVPLKPGAADLLARLAARGLPLAVATSLRTEEAEQHLAQTRIRAFFQAVVGRDAVAQSKPAPDVYLRAAALIGCRPPDCLALEDSFNGIRSAHAAGCMVVMVPDVLAPTPEIKALCHAIARDLGHVGELLQG